MSRPFSYNDENFTTIGNLLVIHFRDDAERAEGELVFEIPPCVYEHMLTNSFFLLAQLVGNQRYTSSALASITEVNNKHFIYFISGRVASDSPRYYIGFTPLKDI